MTKKKALKIVKPGKYCTKYCSFCQKRVFMSKKYYGATPSLEELDYYGRELVVTGPLILKENKEDD